MALYDTTRPMADGRTIASRLTGFFASIAGVFAAWNDARVTRNALSKLSNHELDDLGLSRGDIDRVAGSVRHY